MMKFETISKAKKETGLSYLGSINSSAKIAKNGKVSKQMTYSLYLMPAKFSGYNTCPMATEECIAGCLNTSGRVKLDTKNNILNARDKKTKLYFEERDFFMNWLIAEMTNAKKKAEKNGYGFSARLNCTSDIDWSIPKVNGKNIFEIFSDVQFYDYTKVAKKFNNMPSNYQLTFSYTGYNTDQAIELLNKGVNVAVVFNTKKNQPLPEKFLGFDVADGDLTDYRPDDKAGTIIGLRFKHIKDKDAERIVLNSPFVVDANKAAVTI